MACCCSLAGTAACDSCRNRPYMFATGTTVMTKSAMITYVPERTCEVLGEDYDELLDRWETELSCGHMYHGKAEEVSYCPKCGARVVK